MAALPSPSGSSHVGKHVDDGDTRNNQSRGGQSQIAVIGTGYVGMTTGAYLAHLGHHVICADVVEAKIAMLRRGEIPIVEADLEQLVRDGLEQGRLSFVLGATSAVADAEYVFLCLPTPQDTHGFADVSYVGAAAGEIAPHLQPGAVVINKSTVSVGSVGLVASVIGRADVAVVNSHPHAGCASGCVVRLGCSRPSGGRGLRVVLTGGGGFLGSHVCELLLDRGDEVVAIDNFCTGRLDNIAHLFGRSGFVFIGQNVSEYLHVSGAVDAVMHLASPASPRDYLQSPIQTLKVGSLGTLHTLGLAKAKGARYLVASTSEVYGDPLVHPQNETYWGYVNPVGPRSVYDEAKRFAEAMTMAYHREHGMDVRISRTFNTYGPRMRANDGRVVSNFIVQALEGKPLTVYGDGSQTRSFCYVDDQVRGLVALLDSDYVGPVNIGNPTEFTVLELAHLVLEITGSRSEISFRAPPDR
jgi:dTDP-glucose 4,6-dehydratase